MANLFRTLVALSMLLAICQVALGAKVRQTTSNRLLQNKTPVKIIPQDHYIPQIILMPDEAVTIQDTQIAEYIDVLSNDQFTGYSLDITTLRVLQQPSNGIAGVQNSQVTYQPFPGFNGWDSFSYSVCDAGVCSYSAEVRIYVIPSSSGPQAVPDIAYLIDAPNSISIDVLSNDMDQDGPFANWDSLQVVAQPSHGNAVVTADYKILYTPVWSSNERFVGNDILYYQICDLLNPSVCSYTSVTVTIDQVCTSCSSCESLDDAFKDHLQSIQKVFRTEVLHL